MKFLLFNWDEDIVLNGVEVNDPSELSDDDFEKICVTTGGFIITDPNEFTSLFNSEEISTSTHQLRIVL